MPNTKTDQKVIALSFETISATITAETLQQVLAVSRLTEEQAEFPTQAINAFRRIIEKALENAKREAERSLLADCKAERPAGEFLT